MSAIAPGAATAPRVTGRSGWRELLRRARAAAWLGWQIESNWADALTFTVYTLIRPVGTALILGGMYWAVAGAARAPGLFAGFYVANAVHEYLVRVMIGMGWVVLEEREEYQTLTLVVASPMGLRTYLWGRSWIKFGLATISAIVILVLGWFVFKVRWSWSEVRVLPLLISLALVLLSTLALGMLVAGAGLMLPRIAVSMNEGIAVALYLMCGVIFPVDLMPHGLRELSLALPFTYGYEGVRRFLLGHGASTMLGRWSDARLLGALAASALVMGVASQLGYRALERAARRAGKLDQTTLF